MKIGAIIFDKDGTLFDFQSTWRNGFVAALTELSAGDNDRFQTACDVLKFDPATGFHPDSVVIAGTSGEVADAIAPVFHEFDDLASRLDAMLTNVAQQPAPRLNETLKALALKYGLGVVTNDAEAPARAHLRQAGVEDMFDFIAGYDSGFGFKPDAGPVLAACDALGVTPDQAVMVGDSRHDLHAGRAAGTVTVAVLTGVATADALSDLADAVLPDISHLPDWLA
ncbi:MAG: HAD family hydrolase [Boseongicola sp.]|nr:HAD family hydrolase [Boseongicola sp.]MDD9979426.1 HAD family hydrolase [Boseongicola sp.]